MADATTRSILCRYFLSNTCRDGDQCRFSHDRTTGIVDNVCRYFQKGSCRYGARCRYDHIRKHSNGNKELVSKGKLFKQNDVNQNPQSAGPSGSSSSARAEGKSFAESVRGVQTKEAAEKARLAALPLCEYHMISGACPDKKCRAVHGDLCEICSKYIVHPHNPEFNEQHVKECRETHEKHAELAAAIARSARLQCGVCMDIVLDKEPDLSRRFGILENCPHVFCLACIRQWRQVKNVDVKSARGCPECRTPSDFVTPSAYFVEGGDEKRVLIEGYKAALATKDCKYFNRGKGTCPFANKCFYKHALPDGTLAPDAGPPTTRRRYDSSGHLHPFDPDAVVMDMLDMLRPLRDEIDSDFSFEYSYDYSFDNDFDYDYDYDDLDDDDDDDDMSHD